MKKVISIVLVLVICLSICACGETNTTNSETNAANSKYVGTYEDGSTAGLLNLSYTEIMELHPDGTGIYKEVTTNAVYPKIPMGATIAEGTISWKVVDEYVVITCSYTDYLYKGDNPNTWTLTASEQRETTETYELKGTKLFDVERDWIVWDKTA